MKHLALFCVLILLATQAASPQSKKGRTSKPGRARATTAVAASPAATAAAPSALPFSKDAPAPALPVMTIEGGEPRVFAYTNGQSAFWCGMVQGANASEFHGITDRRRKLFEDVRVVVGGELLDRSTARTEVTPAGFTRRYAAHNTVERAFFADSLTLLAIEIETAYRGDVMVLPVWNRAFARGESGVRGGAFTVRSDELVMHGFARVDGLDDGAWEAPDARVTDKLPPLDGQHAPIWYIGTTTGAPVRITIEFSAQGEVPMRGADEIAARRAARERRITRLLGEIGFASSVPGQREVFDWIAASTDVLVMRQTGRGIYAGLPWFDDYWGRDTFIAFPGALLVMGRFEDAREVLRTFATLQMSDAASPDLGRIPNRVRPDEAIYNTVDGTPWFVLAADAYVDASGDEAFAREILPVLVRAADGPLRHRVDGQGLLTHGDADTWMDAVGPNGPWSPRGSRAVEIQALWHAQLEATARMAQRCGDNRLAERYHLAAVRVARAFREQFIDPVTGEIADRLTGDGRRDMTLRPNVLLAARAGRMLPDSVAVRACAAVLRATVQRAGVMSLAPTDSLFHPWHDRVEAYHKDAAYHNGTIWTWLSGPAISALCRFGAADSAWVLTQSLEELARTQGAVGTIAECLDALPRDGETVLRWSGTFSQAWSDAEYLRVMSEEYMGLRARTVDGKAWLELSPQLPAAVEWMAMNVRCGGSRLRVTWQRSGPNLTATVQHLSGGDVVTIALRDVRTGEARVATRVVPRDVTTVAVGASTLARPWRIEGPVFTTVDPNTDWPSIRALRMPMSQPAPLQPAE